MGGLGLDLGTNASSHLQLPRSIDSYQLKTVWQPVPRPSARVEWLFIPLSLKKSRTTAGLFLAP